MYYYVLMNKETLTVETDEEGTITYYTNGKLHNPHGPAVVGTNGRKSYWINGKRHNPNGPAIVCANGDKFYYINGKLHNPHGPAVVGTNGRKSYYINGELLTKAEFKAWQVEQTAPLHNKTATIDGIEYNLTAK